MFVIAVLFMSIMIEGATTEAMPFGASPCYADVTGDGVPELVVGDSRGFVWIYAQRSARGQFPPRFDRGRFLPTYLGRVLNIDVADYNADGLNDIFRFQRRSRDTGCGRGRRRRWRALRC
jgi:hypothetical protein